MEIIRRNSINTMRAERWTKLIKAMISDTFQEVTTKKNVHELFVCSTNGSSALHFACVGNVENLLFLLRQPKIIKILNKRNDYGETALHWAVKAENLTGVRALLQAGIIVNAGDADGNTALHWAAEYNFIEITRALVTRDCKFTLKNKASETPLQIAMDNDSLEVAEYLQKQQTKRRSSACLCIF